MTNIEIEKAVIFAALTFSGLKLELQSRLQPLHFEDKMCSEIFGKMPNVSSYTILQDVRDYLTTEIEIGTVEEITSYSNEILSNYEMRQLHYAAQAIELACKKGNMQAAQEHLLRAVSKGTGGNKHDAIWLKDTYNELIVMQQNGEKSYTVLPSGIEDLDLEFGGYAMGRGTFNLFAGVDGTGKSTLVESFILANPTVFHFAATTEVGRFDFAKSLVAKRANTSKRDLLQDYANEHELVRKELLERAIKYEMELAETIGTHVKTYQHSQLEQILAKARVFWNECGCPSVWALHLDYIQKMKVGRLMVDSNEGTAQCYAMLNEFSFETGATIFVVSQYNASWNEYLPDDIFSYVPKDSFLNYENKFSCLVKIISLLQYRFSTTFFALFVALRLLL